MMSRIFLAWAAVLIGCLPTQAQDKEKPDGLKAERRTTLASVRALANSAGPAMNELDRKGDRSATDSLSDTAANAIDENGDASETPKPRDAKPRARKDIRAREPAENDRKPAAGPVKRQVQRRPQNDWGRQQVGLGAQPWAGDPWIGDPWVGGWGNGFFSNQITGYRSFRYGGYGWPYSYPGYGYGYGFGFGVGFSPVMPTISGPVTTRYADPVGRQHKMMDDSIRKFAEGK